MNLLHAAALALVGWCLLSPSVLWAQDKMFVAPDRSFSFRYWENLIRCKQGSDGWEPAANCTARVPVCDDLLGRETSVACFGYPRNKFTNSPIPEECDPVSSQATFGPIVGHQTTFDAATVSVEILDEEKAEKGCLAARPKVGEETWVGWTELNGVRFAVFDTGDSGMGSSTGGRAYRTFRRGKCYQLGVNLATSSGTFDPPIRGFTQSEQDEIGCKLEQARKSFRFLK